MMAMVFLDLFGRRALVFHGGWSQGAFLITIGALGRKTSPNVHESNGIVASMQMYTSILHMTLGPGAYITAAEVGTQTLREKTMAFSVGPRCCPLRLNVYLLMRLTDCCERGCWLRRRVRHPVSTGRHRCRTRIHMGWFCVFNFDLGMALYAGTQGTCPSSLCVCLEGEREFRHYCDHGMS